MIPDFFDGVNLPPGGHRCTVEELEARFGIGPQRVQLCEKLMHLLESARKCGFVIALIGGSFPTAKEAPKDLDITWFGPSTLTPNNVTPPCAALMDAANSREHFGCDMMFIPLAPTQPDQIGHWASQFGFDAKTFKDRGTLILELS